ncbi:sedoheptulokinase [Cohnella zeiphila]|uniref:Carbohydrate kinase FGGY N-terminal domain-containing protein n=1 Tax=Cohnella zeiphila TaxID=2761120 RepID=A0A7X0SRG4_9BACL|nr:FGGY family carbohydrate kinase [Cohnella zeiphila]MBB6734792.1 hypothetical protein [Cohnella zeiphila]
MHLIGLDIGTTSVCGALLEARTRRMIRSVTLDNTAALRSSRSWEFAQDAESIWRTAESVLSELRSDRAEVLGIGITGQMHGILYVDKEGNAVSPLYTWQDKRGDMPYSKEATYAEQLARLTCYPMATGFGMATHFYNQQNGLVPPGASALCTIADYVAMRLANRTRPLIDPTNASGLGLYDPRLLEFDRAALTHAEIDAGLLPEQVPSGTVIGRIKDGIPVATALGDNQASFLGAVPDVRSSVLLNIGTGSQISVYSDAYCADECRTAGGIDIRPFPGGGYLLVGASLSGGKSYALLERFFREVITSFTGSDESSLYETMNRMAEAETADEFELKVNTRFFGTRADPLARGTIDGVCPDNWTPGHLIRGFLEGMAGELAGYYDLLPPSVRERAKALVVSGNGVRRNGALRRILERLFGLPLLLPDGGEEASRGAAICAGVGCGLYASF